MRMEDTTNIHDHSTHLRDHLKHVKDTGRPMFIMNQSGEAEAVVMDAHTFDQLMEKADLARRLDMLDGSMREIQAERGDDFRKSIRGIAGELGLELER